MNRSNLDLSGALCNRCVMHGLKALSRLALLALVFACKPGDTSSTDEPTGTETTDATDTASTEATDTASTETTDTSETTETTETTDSSETDATTASTTMDSDTMDETTTTGPLVGPCSECGNNEICLADMISDACAFNDPFSYTCVVLPDACGDDPSCADQACVEALCGAGGTCETFDCKPMEPGVGFVCGV